MSYGDYGNPFEDGFLGELLNVEDLKEVGLIAGSALGTMWLSPKVMNLVDKFVTDANTKSYVKGGIGILGGFAVYKYGRRFMPTAVAQVVGGVLIAQGAITLANKLFKQTLPGGFAALPQDIEQDLLALMAVEDEPLQLADGYTYADDSDFQGTQTELQFEGEEDDDVAGFEDVDMEERGIGDTEIDQRGEENVGPVYDY
jgi:hypothetical protein